jgi:hypothetical protein
MQVPAISLYATITLEVAKMDAGLLIGLFERRRTSALSRRYTPWLNMYPEIVVSLESLISV